MPAAAVIPAPRVYTNIAAVETLVVDARTRGCGVALSAWLASVGRCSGGTQPPAVCPRDHCTHGTDVLLPETSFSGGQRGDASDAGMGTTPSSEGG